MAVCASLTTKEDGRRELQKRNREYVVFVIKSSLRGAERGKRLAPENVADIAGKQLGRKAISGQMLAFAG